MNQMKIFSTVLLLILNINVILAQSRKNSNEVALIREINVSEWSGKNYRFSADIRCENYDEITEIGINTVQVGKEKFDLLNHTAAQNRISPSTENKNWKTITIEGKIDPQSKLIWLYLLAFGNGKFYFDNLKLSIQSQSGWISIPMENSGFEETDEVKKVLKAYKNTVSLNKNDHIKASIVKLGDNNALMFDSRNNTFHYETYYGYNPVKGKYITMPDGKKIYCEIYGQGEPFLLLHGNGDSINTFKNQIPEFAKYYQVIAIDTRGQGKSTDNDTESFNYQIFEKDLEEIIRQLQLQKVSIVGWSDGAITGMLYAMEQPEKVHKLVLMGANLNSSEEAVTSKILSQTRKDIDRLKKQNDPKNRTTIKLLEMILKEPNIPASELSKIKAETLVMAGEKDLILEKHTQLIAQNIPHSELKIVKRENHFLPDENSVLFNSIVLEFLKR
ncbi:alpha/beta hydrolase [Chryseobacterium sp. 2987]|uniref:alpha/beta fold hydrolase n=1 Tax=Chryseobacterium sp. 2987 TaxID=2817767 RepID=UPI0028598323|nr:alpha/beta hydrolase [Chryseobacterium sp. 2987]MDR6920669.1 pimeloyl-ACP methyl ester carboxylesterase [Chryseobacterium sp. 2987]